MLACMALGLGAKLAGLLFLLVIQIPIQRAVSYLSSRGLLPSYMATIVSDGLPLVALFLVINALNALPEPEDKKTDSHSES
jgi:hypothetical protein